jgi:cell division protein FtsB
LQYDSKDAAELSMAFNTDAIRKKNGYAPIRAYYCGGCSCWHTTSQPANSKQKRKEAVIEPLKEMLSQEIQLAEALGKIETLEKTISNMRVNLAGQNAAIKRLKSVATVASEPSDIAKLNGRIEKLKAENTDLHISNLILETEIEDLRAKSQRSLFGHLFNRMAVL